MALSGELLGTTVGLTLFNAIPASVKANMSPAQLQETLTNLQDAWKLIANDIVTHIQTNATVDVSVTVAAGIVVAGASAAGPVTGATTSPGTGTGTGTIS